MKNNLPHAIELILTVKYSVELGQSIREGVRNFLRSTSENKFRELVILWLASYEAGVPTQKMIEKISNTTHRHLIMILERGLAGEPIMNFLIQLEKETYEQSQIEIDKFLLTLPIKALLPLVLFVFPSVMILILGPILVNLAQALR